MEGTNNKLFVPSIILNDRRFQFLCYEYTNRSFRSHGRLSSGQNGISPKLKLSIQKKDACLFNTITHIKKIVIKPVIVFMSFRNRFTSMRSISGFVVTLGGITFLFSSPFIYLCSP